MIKEEKQLLWYMGFMLLLGLGALGAAAWIAA